MKIYSFIYLGLALTMAGCAGTFSARQSTDPVSQIMSEYYTVAIKNAAATAGAPDPNGLGDISGLSDEELLAQFKEKLLSDLEHLKNSISEAQDRGIEISEELLKGLERHEEEVEKILARLDTDADFRQQTLDSLRNAPVDQPHSIDSLPPDFCERFGQLLASGLVPESIRPNIQNDYDQKCSE